MTFEVGQQVVILTDIIEPASGDNLTLLYAKAGDIVTISWFASELFTHYIHVAHSNVMDGRIFSVALNEIAEIEKEPEIRHHPSYSHIIPLLSCPLCDDDADFVEYVEDNVWTAECTNCGLTLGLPNGYASRLDLVNDWNTRVNSQAVPPQINALTAALAIKRLKK